MKLRINLQIQPPLWCPFCYCPAESLSIWPPQTPDHCHLSTRFCPSLSARTLQSTFAPLDTKENHCGWEWIGQSTDGDSEHRGLSEPCESQQIYHSFGHMWRNVSFWTLHHKSPSLYSPVKMTIQCMDSKFYFFYSQSVRIERTTYIYIE